MNTPAHLTASLLAWNQEEKPWVSSAIALGAFLPDLPMFAFYGIQSLVLGTSEQVIWSQVYFQENWQLFFDLFNSIPIFLLIFLLARNNRVLKLLAGSALLHLCLDLPLHHDDAHRHFLPLSHWRFMSPVSYWDPKHFGWISAPVELIMAIGGSLYVAKKGSLAMQKLAKFNLLLYFLFLVFALVFWIPELAR